MSANSNPTAVRAPSRGQRLFLLTEAALSKIYTMLGDDNVSD